MAVLEATIAPFINKVFTITGTQYYYHNSGKPHGGLDLSTGFKDNLYSMVEGTVISVVHNHSSYGNYIIIQDDTTGDTFLYAHMDSIDLAIQSGGHVSMNQLVGVEGRTGSATGVHVHLELQYLDPGDDWVWNVPYNSRPNVAEYMGLTNTYHLQAIYDGEPGPTPPPPPPVYDFTPKKKFPWFIYNHRRMTGRKRR